MKKKGFAIVLASISTLSALCAFSGCGNFFEEPDYAAWSKNIVNKTLLSSVLVEETERAPGQTVDQGDISQGSGIIFYETEEMYYALTNNHVVYKADGMYQSVEVVNCYDSRHTASVVYQNATYDLAVITFNKRNHQQKFVDLEVTALAAVNPEGLRALAAIGSPNGRHNSVTFGRALRYETVSLGGTSSALESNVQFPSLVHDVYTLSGSSGGAIINEQLELVGVHYACGYDGEGVYVEGYAIPVDKIWEFLQEAETKTNVELGV